MLYFPLDAVNWEDKGSLSCTDQIIKVIYKLMIIWKLSYFSFLIYTKRDQKIIIDYLE